MKIVAKKSELLGALKRVNLIKGSSVMPILECVLLEVDDKENATAARTNMEVRISAGLEAISSSPGIACIPAKTLQNIVENLDKEITLEVDKKRLIIRDESQVFNMSMMDATDFPKEFEWEGGFKSFDIGCLTFLKALRATSHNCKKDETRKILQGIHFKKDKELLIEATDGKSASRFEPDVEILGKHDFVIVKKCGIIDLLASVDVPEDPEDPEPQCTVMVWKNAIEIKVDKTRLSAKLIEGKYVDINKVMPEKFEFTAHVSKHHFLKTLNSANVIEPEYITIEMKEASIKILSNSKLGDYFEYLEAEYTGKEMALKFAPGLLIPGLSHMGSTIKMSMNEGPGAVLFESEKYKFVAMPLRDKQ